MTQASKEINVDIRTIKGWWFETGFESWLSEERAKWYLGQAEVHTRMLSEKAIESGNASDHKKAVDAAHKTSAAIFSQAKDSEARKGQSGVNTDDVDATQLIKDANKHNLTVINGNGE